MKSIRTVIVMLALLALPALNLAAEEASGEAAPDSPARRPAWYIGINPIALGQFLGNNIAPVVTAIGFISGAESGVALYGGREFSRSFALEVRLSSGPLNQALWDTQAQVGLLWYPCEMFFGWNGGPLAGLFFRNIGLANTLTGVWVFSHVPELVVGWRFWAVPVAIDLRVGWNFCAFSWSTMAHTSAGLNWISLPYGLTFSVGVAFGL
jgi:hypothetical protein